MKCMDMMWNLWYHIWLFLFYWMLLSFRSCERPWHDALLGLKAYLSKNKHSTPVCETAKETLKYRTVLWTLWERESVGRFGRTALKHVKYHVWNETPVQVRCTILDAWGWCTGMTQWDGMGREEGGGFRMGNTCITVADSFWYLAKPIQYCKV